MASIGFSSSGALQKLHRGFVPPCETKESLVGELRGLAEEHGDESLIVFSKQKTYYAWPKINGRRICLALTTLKPDPYSLSNQANFVLKIQDSTRSTSYKIFDGLAIKQVFETIVEQLNGNRVEVVCEKVDKYDLRVVPSDHWNPSWWHLSGQAEFYDTQVYPYVLEYLKFFIGSRSANVVELCGGDGRFAKQVLSACPNVAYRVLEWNDESIKWAIDNLSPFRNASVSKIDLKTVDFSESCPGQVNVICGVGALTTQIFIKREALNILINCFKALCDNGIIILTGLAHSLVTKEDLGKCGFEPINLSNPHTKQAFYVARKKTRIAAARL